MFKHISLLFVVIFVLTLHNVRQVKAIPLKHQNNHSFVLKLDKIRKGLEVPEKIKDIVRETKHDIVPSEGIGESKSSIINRTDPHDDMTLETAANIAFAWLFCIFLLTLIVVPVLVQVTCVLFELTCLSLSCCKLCCKLCCCTYTRTTGRVWSAIATAGQQKGVRSAADTKV